MTRGPGHRAHSDAHHSDAHADMQAEVAATTTAITGLCRRLSRPGLSEHPNVRRELRKLEELLAAFEQAGRQPGRHRAGSDESDRKPDPSAAQSAAEYVTVLRQYRAWSGDLPWREIAARAKQNRVHSTIYNAMRRDALPTLAVVKAIVIGCGGSEDDLLAFTAAWHRISSVRATSHAENSTLRSAPVPALQLRPGT